MATEQFENLSVTALDEDIDASVTSFDVVDASLLSSGGQFRINIEDELMLVTGVATNTLTVTRGIEGTTGASHTTGDTVSQVLTAGALHKRTEDDCLVAAYSARPAAGRAGRLFLPSDDNIIYRDTGSVWNGIGLFHHIGEAPPVASAFSQVNNSDAVLSDENGTLSLTAPSNGTSVDYQLFVLNPGAAPYSLTATILAFCINTEASADSFAVGLCFHDDSSSNFSFIGVRLSASATGQTIIARRYSGFASGVTQLFNSNTWGFCPIPHPSIPITLKIEDDNTNRNMYVSFDGINFILIHSETRSTIFTADRVGLFINPRYTTVNSVAPYMRVIGWEQSW